MDKIKVAQALVAVAKSLMAGSDAPRELTAGINILQDLIPQNAVGKLRKNVDEQTWELAYEVYKELQEALELTSGQQDALNRLMQSVDRAGSMSEGLHRNNIFKAAHALGIKLPSMSF